MMKHNECSMLTKVLLGPIVLVFLDPYIAVQATDFLGRCDIQNTATLSGRSVTARQELGDVVTWLATRVAREAEYEAIEKVLLKHAAEFAKTHVVEVVDQVSQATTSFVDPKQSPRVSIVVKSKPTKEPAPIDRLWNFEIQVLSVKGLSDDNGEVKSKDMVLQLIARALGENAIGRDEAKVTAYAFAPFRVRLDAMGNCKMLTSTQERRRK